MKFVWLREHSAILLRYGIGILFLWFGINQVFNAEAWTVWIPTEIANLVEPLFLIYVNGIVETVLGLFILLGLFTRFSALVLSLHLFGIAFSIGYNDIAVRDFSLAIATLAVAFYGSDKWSYDRILRKSWWGHTSLAKFLYFYEKDE